MNVRGPHIRPCVYVLSCGDGSLYTGATTDLARRVVAHRRGRGAKYTRGRLPIELIAWWHPQTFAAAKSQEAQFKRLSRSRKLAALRESKIYGCRVHAPAAFVEYSERHGHRRYQVDHHFMLS